jgi:hypothetical protein
MGMKIVTIDTYHDDASVSVDLEGFQGKGCHAIQEAFGKALGTKGASGHVKPEYNRPCDTKTKISQGQ